MACVAPLIAIAKLSVGSSIPASIESIMVTYSLTELCLMSVEELKRRKLMRPDLPFINKFLRTMCRYVHNDDVTLMLQMDHEPLNPFHHCDLVLRVDHPSITIDIVAQMAVVDVFAYLWEASKTQNEPSRQMQVLQLIDYKLSGTFREKLWWFCTNGSKVDLNKIALRYKNIEEVKISIHLCQRLLFHFSMHNDVVSSAFMVEYMSRHFGSLWHPSNFKDVLCNALIYGHTTYESELYELLKSKYHMVMTCEVLAVKMRALYDGQTETTIDRIIPPYECTCLGPECNNQHSYHYSPFLCNDISAEPFNEASLYEREESWELVEIYNLYRNEPMNILKLMSESIEELPITKKRKLKA